MNRAEFLGELTDKLAGLPTEERQAAVRYYEEYFEEAGPEREQEIVAELISPEKVAESILLDYSSVPIVTDKVTYNRQAAAEEQPTDDTETAQSAYQDEQGQGQEQTQSQAPNYNGESTGSSWERLRSWAESKMPLWAWVLVLVFGLPTIFGVVSGVLGLAGGLLSAALAVCGVIVSVAAALFIACFAVGLLGLAMVLGGLALLVSGVVAFVGDPALGMLSIGIGALLASLGLLILVLGIWIAAKLIPRLAKKTVELFRKAVNSIGVWVRKVSNKI